MGFLTSNIEIATQEVYILCYQCGIRKLERKRKTTPDLKNLLSAISTHISEAEQLAQSSWDITICSRKGKTVSLIFKGSKENTIIFIRCSKLWQERPVRHYQHVPVGTQTVDILSFKVVSLQASNNVYQICIAKASCIVLIPGKFLRGHYLKITLQCTL